MLNNLFILSISLFLIIRGSTLATKYSAQLAQNYKLSKYLVGFIIVAIISILPEALIAINASISGIPSFGLGTLLGTSIADMTLVFAIIIFVNGRSIRVESKILKNNIVYPFILLIPILFGLDGHFSRLEGLVLVLTGIIFYYLAFRNNNEKSLEIENIEKSTKIKNLIFLILSMALLLAGAHFTVTSAVDIASQIGINPILIGIFIISIGTVVPELLFSIKSVKENHDSLAIGDLLGTVLADSTIIIGIMALISPFYFPKNIIYVTGIFMVSAAFILFYFMKTDKKLSKKEGLLLFLYWVLFIIIELIVVRQLS